MLCDDLGRGLMARVDKIVSKASDGKKNRMMDVKRAFLSTCLCRLCIAILATHSHWVNLQSLSSVR